MTCDKVLKWEQEARDIAAEMEQTSFTGWKATVGDRTNIKPWYSPRSSFRQKGGVVLIGANPAGCPSSPPDDSVITDYQSNLIKPDYNAYLCESWSGKEPGRDRLQLAVKRVFKALYGNEWEQRLRDAAFFNVCPLRTRSTNEKFLPSPIWDRSVNWCKLVLDQLRPSTLILVGNGESGTSPWSALGVMGYKVSEDMGRRRLVGKNYYLKFGEIRKGRLKDAKVVGLPHLSWYRSLYDFLREDRNA